MPGHRPGVVVQQAAPVATEREIAVAKALEVPLLSSPLPQSTNTPEFVLQVTEQGLSIQANAPDAPGPLIVDFTTPKLIRRASTSLKKQNLGRAIGLKRSQSPTILDATAGLGSDAFLMAMAGCHVTMLERSAVVAAMLEDGLSRAALAGGTVARAVERMQLTGQDFLRFESAEGAYDVVYLDPMFPEDTRSARSKKPMYVLQQLLEKVDEETALLARALKLARRRVVVKRARLSPGIDGPEPDIQIKGSSSRYDVYLIGSA